MGESPNIQKLKEGDEAEWEKAFRKLWPLAFGCMRAPDKFRGLLEDAAEEALIVIWKRREHFESWRHVENELCKITRFRFISKTRSPWEKRRTGIDEIEPVQSNTDDECAERERLVLEAMAELSTRDRQFLHDYYWSGLKPAKIAEKYDVSPKIVHNALNHARQRVREKLCSAKKREELQREFGYEKRK